MGTSKVYSNPSEKHTDHPHAYGDKKFMTNLQKCGRGSSPRVWGQASHTCAAATHTGIIPTRMGTSLASIPQVLTKKDHPHAYGDKLMSIQEPIICLGSSPRVWGQGASEILSPAEYGDHPHAYGDKDLMIINELSDLGSSPRVWGQVICFKLLVTCIRIIPTRMGTRNITILCVCGREDHPHAYGDKATITVA